MRAGVVGAGRMGAAMIARLRGAGFPVLAFDVRLEALEPFAGDPGVVRAGSPGELARGADCVAIVVNTDDQVLEVALGGEGVLEQARPGTPVLIHSTVRVETLRRLAGPAGARGVPLLDAAVSGTRGERSAGQLCVMVGGDAAALERVRPLLESYGDLILHLGPLGAGMDAKLARNAMVYLLYLAAHESMALAERLSVQPDAMRRILEHTGLGSESQAAFLATRPTTDPIDPRLEPERFAHLSRVAEMARKDLRAALERGLEVGLDLPCARLAVERMAAVFGVEEAERAGQRGPTVSPADGRARVRIGRSQG